MKSVIRFFAPVVVFLIAAMGGWKLSRMYYHQQIDDVTVTVLMTILFCVYCAVAEVINEKL